MWTTTGPIFQSLSQKSEHISKGCTPHSMVQFPTCVYKLHLYNEHLHFYLIRCFHTLVKSAYLVCHICPFIYPCVLAQLALDRFLWNFILDTVIRIYHGCPNLVNIGQKYKALYMKTWAHFILADDMKSSSFLCNNTGDPLLHSTVTFSVFVFVRQFILTVF
jgi:hypothetical protein